MSDTIDRFINDLGPLLLHVLGAVAILIVGYLLAKLISSMVQKALGKTGMDNRIAGFFVGEDSDPVKVEPILGRIVFWLIMVMAFVAALQVLSLSFVTEPLNAFLEEVLGYLPNLLAAGLLILLAFLVSGALRFASRRALEAFGVDQRFRREMADDHGTPPAETTTTPTTTTPATAAADGSLETRQPTPISESLSTAVYYLVWLLFLPAILDALRLSGLLAPVRNMLDEALHFLPNLLAAILIGVVGFFIARLLRKIVTSLSSAAGVDTLSERLGMSRVLGSQRLSQTLGTIAYVLVLIPVLIAALNALQIEAVTEPASRMLNVVLTAIPMIFAAAIVLIIAYVVGKLLAGLVASLLSGIGFNRMLAKVGLTDREDAGPDGRTAADVVGAVVLVVVMLFASMEAASLLSFDGLAVIIGEILELGGQILLGLAIFGLGLYLAGLARDAIHDSGVDHAVSLGRLGYVAVVILAGAMALRQMGLADSIINLAFGLLLGAVAVAAAIAYGWGGRDLAREHLQSLQSKADSAKGRDPSDRNPRPPSVST